MFGIARYPFVGYHRAMARRWTANEEKEKRQELVELYVRQNKTIFEIAPTLSMTSTGVYDRLCPIKNPYPKRGKTRL